MVNPTLLQPFSIMVSIAMDKHDKNPQDDYPFVYVAHSAAFIMLLAPLDAIHT